VTDLPPPAPGCTACAARDREIADLHARVERLERALSRNSGFSELQAVGWSG
jgi:hypothetical protein